MTKIVVLSTAPAGEALPSLTMLQNSVTWLDPRQGNIIFSVPSSPIIFVDARENLITAKELCLKLAEYYAPDSSITSTPTSIILIVNDNGLAAVTSEWNITDFTLPTASPSELAARIRLHSTRNSKHLSTKKLNNIGLIIDEKSYSAKAHGHQLDLTFKEFELLRYLANSPEQVFSREQLLSEVWGYDYFGGTRTVDVHIRRLRAKLGDLESIIGTVRNVGYQFTIKDRDETGN